MLHQAARGARYEQERMPAPRAAGLQPWVIPFDYGARFELTGRPGNVVQDVINIGPDGVFVATAIGYGFEEDRSRATQILGSEGGPVGDTETFVPEDLTLSDLPVEALVQGFRVSPKFDAVMFGGPAGGAGTDTRTLTDQQIAGVFAGRVFQLMRNPRPVSFLFSMVDSASGRELQDEPAHNLASLGISNGERPFRPLARPLTFIPRSTVRLQVIERSADTRGTLFIVLFGYRMITGTHCPEPMVRAISAGAGARAAGPSSERIIPFDYVAVLPLTGRPGSIVEGEVPINAEGGFIATDIGYGLEQADDGLDLLWDEVAEAGELGSISEDDLTVWDENKRVNLADFPLTAFPPDVLRDGVRIRSNHLRFAFINNGSGSLRLGDVPLALVPGLFESLNRPDSVSFRYEIFDTGSGRDLQNIPLFNIAGVGIANGDRPFKRFARPMAFLPRATIRIRIEEGFGRGNLFFVFQGYKLLGVTESGAR
jgi:hypothetical protein